MEINPKDFILKEIPTYHPLSGDYITFWREQKQRCIEGHWLGGYYMPPGLYFYTNYGTILRNTKKSRNVKVMDRPDLRDIEWLFFINFTIARGFSGFEGDEEFTGNWEVLSELPDEDLKVLEPSVFKTDGTRKEFRHPRTLLEMKHPYHKGRPLFDNPAWNFMMLGSRDFGKALPLTTIIPTLSGNTLMGDLKVSDKVLSIDGKETTILGVFPQGSRPCYKLTFKDGRTIEADEEHLWELYKQNTKVVITTKELTKDYKRIRKVSTKNKRGVENIYFLPKISPVDYSEKSLPLDPYTLGVLLGDGSLTQQVSFTTADADLISHIPYEVTKLKGKYAYSIKGLNPLVKQLGLDCKSEFKFIPEEYKYASIEQRYELLRGLMDTDGSVDKNGSVEFSSSSKMLAKDVVSLLRSLGILCKITKRKTTKLDNWRVFIYTAEPIFKLDRKLSKLRSKSTHQKTALVDVEYIGEKETQCITVDHKSHLFLATEDFIPTHNSYMVGVGVVLHQWLINGAVEYNPSAEVSPVDITVGAELAHYSTNLLKKTKFALDNLPGAQVIGNRRYPSPLFQNYRGSWGVGQTVEAYYRDWKEGGWSDAGSKSVIRNRTFKDNPFADQGTRPAVMVLEEIGMFGNLKEVFTNTRDNLRNDLRKTGTLMMLGTGGDMEHGTLDAAEMFYDPEAYDILPFQDKWEERGNIGFFVPAYMALNDYKNEHGFTIEEKAKTAVIKNRDKARSSKGGSEALNKEIQYRPLVPSEMFLAKTANIFPATEIRNRISELQINNTYELLEKKVELFFNPKSIFNGVDYRLDMSLEPINKHPWKSDNVEGAVVIYEFPHLDNDSKVPPDAYIIGFDSFRANVQYGESFAAIYVMKTNKYPSTVGHNEIVATYIGRPYLGINEVNEILYKLSLFYGNAKIYFENTAGNTKDYFEKIRRLDLLARQPSTVLNRKASFDTKESVIYGYPMSNDKIKWEAIKYLRSWLLEVRGDNNNKRNIDTIPDLYLLQQLLHFNMDGNFDAVMGVLGCIIGLEEIHNISVRTDKSTVEWTEYEKQFYNTLTNNKYVFVYKNKEIENEEFSKTASVIY